MAILLTVKSVLGLGIFTSPYGYAKVGLIWGAILSLLVCYVVSYGIVTLLTVTNELEVSSRCSSRSIKTYHDSAMFCFKKTSQKQIIKVLVILSCTIANIAVIVANTSYTANFLSGLFGYNNVTVIKIGITIIFMIVICVIPEPEKIKYFALPAFIGVAIVLTSMVAYNGYESMYYWDDNLTRDLFVFENTTLYIGIALYSYEGVATVFTIRNTMRKPRHMHKYVIKSYSIMVALFVIIGVSFYLNYGDEKLLQSSFDYWPRSGPTLGYL